MVKSYYIYGCSVYYIYGQILLHLWFVDLLHLWLKVITFIVTFTFMVNFYYIYGWYYIYGFYYICPGYEVAQGPFHPSIPSQFSTFFFLLLKPEETTISVNCTKILIFKECRTSCHITEWENNIGRKRESQTELACEV